MSVAQKRRSLHFTANRTIVWRENNARFAGTKVCVASVLDRVVITDLDGNVVYERTNILKTAFPSTSRTI